MEKRFLTASETASYLGLSEDTIRCWSKRGQIPHLKFGGALRFDLRKMEVWIKKRECPTISEYLLDKKF